MLVEIFIALIQDILGQTGGSLPRAELVDELGADLEETAFAGAPRERVEELLDQVVAAGPVMQVGDDVVDVATAIEHVGFTHRLAAHEVDGDLLDLDADLALIARLADPDPLGGLHQPDGAPLRLVVTHEDAAGLGGTHLRTARLAGPTGWLGSYEPGSVVVVSVARGVVRIRPLTADEPAPTPEHGADLGARSAEALREAIEAATEGDGSPVGVDQLQAAGLVGGWLEPGPDRPPFGEVLAGAGLERSGDLAATPDRWEPHALVAEAIVVLARHADHLDAPETSALLAAVRAFRSWQADRSSTPPRSALAAFHRMPEAALCLEEELVRADPTGADLTAFLDAFDRPGGTVAAVLDTLRALAADLAGRADDAEALLHAARTTAPDWFPATEALAHLHEVRGQAQEAVNLLQTTRTAQDAELQILRLRTRLSTTSAGRNDPCPCGSGRKYKQCHVGQTLLPPEVQVSWLLDKARTHLNRYGPFAVTDRLPARTDLHADAELIAADTALFAFGGLARFLDARRPLLPPDEVALCEAWTLGNRPGLYRIVGGDYGDRSSDAVDGDTVVLVDVATHDPFVVQGTDLFDGADLADVVWCRLLPDGERWWTSGFARGVEPDEVAILAAASAPGVDPVVLHRALLGLPASVRVDAGDGNPKVLGFSTWTVGTDREAIEAVLDAHAERQDERAWTVADDHGQAMHLVLAAPLALEEEELDGEELDDVTRRRIASHSLLVETDSVERNERALELVAAWFPEAELWSDHSTPLAAMRALQHVDELMEALHTVEPDPELMAGTDLTEP